MPIQIHGKSYVTVDERVKEAGEDFLALNTEVLQHTPVVVIKATITTTKGTFTGISYANINKSIEKQSPYEVAETSAVGRALGFAGYGIVEGIASADEMVKAIESQPSVSTPPKTIEGRTCPKCNSPLIHTTTGNGKELTKCSTNRWNAQKGIAEGCDFVEWGAPKQELVRPANLPPKQEEPPLEEPDWLKGGE